MLAKQQDQVESAADEKCVARVAHNPFHPCTLLMLSCSSDQIGVNWGYVLVPVYTALYTLWRAVNTLLIVNNYI